MSDLTRITPEDLEELAENCDAESQTNLAGYFHRAAATIREDAGYAASPAHRAAILRELLEERLETFGGTGYCVAIELAAVTCQAPMTGAALIGPLLDLLAPAPEGTAP